MKTLKIALFLIIIISCSSNEANRYEVKSISAMKNVMWKGELESKIKLDSILPQKGLYGLGPLENLKGEITIIDGTAYVATINDNKEINVEIKNNVGAPFFVYCISNNFESINLPEDVIDLKTLDLFLQKHHDSEVDFLFKLVGEVEFSKIHVQNLKPDSKVSSPKEAHAGQVNMNLDTTNIELIGFYSNSAHGVYTHHDTNIHTHLITEDKKYMGHCDELKFNPKLTKLYISKNQ